MRFFRHLAIILPSIGVVACTALLGDFSVGGENGTGNGDDGGGEGGEGSVAITIAVAPLDPKLGVLRSQAFTATGGDVTWSLQEGATAGTIDEKGLYLSGTTPGTYHVVATSKVDPSKSASTSVIVVNLGLQVLLGQNGGRGNIDGPAKRAHFNSPEGVAHIYDNSSNDQQYFIADTGNHTIRGWSSKSGKVTTIAGLSGEVGTTDGIGNGARFSEPRTLAMDTSIKRLYVLDHNGTCVRAVDVMTGAVKTVAGVCGTTGSSDGVAGVGGNPPSSVATFQRVESIALSGDRHSALYVCDSNSMRRIELVSPSSVGVARTMTPSASGCNPLAVDYWNGGFTDKVIFYGEGSTLKKINEVGTWPSSLPVTVAETVTVTMMPDSFDSFGLDYNTLYASLSYKGVIYRLPNFNNVAPTFETTPWAGVVNDRRVIDGNLQTGRFGSPTQLDSFTEYGRLLVADSNASAIREIGPSQQTVTTPVGAAHVVDLVDGPRQMARITGPFSLAADDKGALFFGDISFDSGPINNTIRKYDRVAQIASTLAGVPTRPFDVGNPPADGPKDQARFWFPIDMTFVKGNLYVVDSIGQAVRKVDTATGTVSTLAGEKAVPGVSDGIGELAHFKFVDTGASGSGGSGAGIFGGSITTDGTNLYVSDSGSFAIRKIAIATGMTTTIAGGTQGNQNGTGKAAQFVFPMGLTFDNGNLYIADWQDHTIRRMNLTTNVVDTFIGLSGQQGDKDGDAATATLNSPFRMVADGLGNLYFSELPLTDQGQPAGIIRRVDIKNRKVSAFAGTPGQIGLQPAPIPSTLNCPTALSITDKRDLVFGDFCEATIGIFQPL